MASWGSGFMRGGRREDQVGIGSGNDVLAKRPGPLARPIGLFASASTASCSAQSVSVNHVSQNYPHSGFVISEYIMRSILEEISYIHD